MSKISFEGYNTNCATFKKADSADLKKGNFVKISDNYTVKQAAAGDDIIGYCIDVNGDYVTVQTSGYIKAIIEKTDNLALGYSSISVNGEQQIVSSTTARKVLVIEINASERTIGFIL